MQINSLADADLADALVQLDWAIREELVYEDLRVKLAGVLDLTNPGWRDDEVVVAWVKDRGLVEAGKSLLRRHLT